MNRIMNLISDYPLTGLGTWAGGWIGSFLPTTKIAFIPILLSTAELRANNIWILQMISLVIGSIAGFLTIVVQIQKLITRIKDKKVKLD